MAAFFGSLWDIISSVIEFFKSLVTGLITLFKLIPQILSTTTSAIGYLPSIIVVFATLTITISVIFIIVGRDTGSG